MRKVPRAQIHIYTGNGKGKTTASLGFAIRAVGQGKKVAIVYFDKGGSFYGERRILRRFFRGSIDYFVTGCTRFNRKTRKFRFGVEERDRKEAMRGLRLAEKMMKEGNYHLMILDEINSTTSLGMLEFSDVITLMKSKPKKLELVMTGRNCPQEFIEHADLVTEMKLIKHYFYKGVPARRGIEY
jgi:cob(I)alamin adenosyltransferase